jgi:hypothetical protein
MQRAKNTLFARQTCSLDIFDSAALLGDNGASATASITEKKETA